MTAGVQEILRYRGLVWSLVRRDVKRRYKGSILGFLWHLVNPLLVFGVLWFVFSRFLRFEGMLHYAVYLLAGLLAWNLLSQSVLGASINLATSGGLIRKVYIPKAVFPLASVGGNLVNFVLSLVPLILVILIEGTPIGPSLLFVPVAVILLLTFCTGLALVVSSMNVFYRDVHHIAEVLFLCWFWATPIVWPKEVFQDRLRQNPDALLQLLLEVTRWNPMALLIDCFRIPIYEGSLPPLRTVGIAAGSALAVLLVGAVLFRRLESRFIYHL